MKEELNINTGSVELDKSIMYTINRFRAACTSVLTVQEGVDNGSDDGDGGIIYYYRLKGDIFGKPLEVELSFHIKPEHHPFKYIGYVRTKDEDRKRDIFSYLAVDQANDPMDNVDFDAIDKAHALVFFRSRNDKEGDWGQCLLGDKLMPVVTAPIY